MRLLSRRKLTLVAIGILFLIRYTTPTRTLSDDKNDPTGKSSLAFVFDITGSMFDDLVQVREGAAKIFKTVMAQREKLIYNYIMVPFHDPHLGDIINTTDSTYFMRQLGKVYVHGGGDCPEKTLTGIQKALEISLPTSFIYVFTDARSKDYHLEDEVLNLIQEKQSSVVFVMTGDCGNRTHPGFRTYEKIAAASFGQVFHLEKSDVSTVLEYVRHAVKQKKVHVMYEARERGGTTVRTIPVDAHLSELTISLSGDKDDSDVLDITLRDPNGAAVDKQSYSKEGGTIDLKNVKLIRLKNPIPGPWQVITNSRLKHTIRVFGHGTTDFKYGFSARPLEHSDLLSFTRPRPVLNQNTYLIINMTGLIPPGMVSEISLVDYHGNQLYSNTASPHRTNPHMYFVGPFIPPKGLFFVQVTGVDEEDYEFKRIAPTAIGSVVVGGPRAFMASYHEAFVGNDLNITCTVESVSPYTVYWNRGGQRIGGPLFYQNTDSAVWSITELSLKDGGEYQCQVISDNGNHSISTRVEPRESPPMILGARNVSVPNGSPAFLHCPARSAGPVEIRWIRHGATVFTGPNTERNLINGTLKIHVVSRADAGLYECQARNAGGMSSQVIRLDIMEPPTVQANPDEVHYNPNDEITLNCAGNGEPKPELHWYLKGRRLTSDGKYYLGAESKTLMIRGTTAYDEGQYECRAMSPAGQDIDAVDVILAVAPKVELTQSKTMVGRGDSISFECKIVTGKPYPKIRWLRNGKDLLVHDDKYIKISGTNLFITGAQDSDAGSYSCVAENMAGRDINVAQLAIGRIPSIVPSPETVRVNIERQVTLQCLAIGFPAPEIEWEKGGVSIKNLNNERYTQLADGNLLISDAQVEDQDRFTCIAKNVYGQQSQTTTVMVTGLVSPVLGHVPPEEQLIEGQDLHLSCVVVLGTPRPNIVWLKDGNPIETSSTLIIEGGGTSLLLRGGDPKDEGKYTCVAVSPAGNATLNINVQLIKKPEFVSLSEKPSEKPVVPGIEASHVAIVNSTHDVLDGEGFAIPCVVSGQPPPTITWYLDGRPIAANSKDFVILPDNTLVVKRADKSYGGKYACQATNSAGEEQQTTTVRIMTSPSISPGQSSFNMVVNQSLTIPCDVFGDPKPKISWFLDEKPFVGGMINEDGSLTIPMVRENHRGTLSCKAENAAGNDTRTVTLTVHTTPQINADNQDRSVVKNSSLTLECPAQALPPPVRIWTYEGEKIDTLPIAHTILKDGSLVLHNVDVTNAGLFSCHVSNLAGEDSLTYKVSVLEAPKIVSDVATTVEVVKGLTIEIPCRATGIPVVDRVWQKDGYLFTPDGVKAEVDSHGTLRIYDAKKDDGGNYNCLVSNSVGGDTKSTSIVVHEPPTILPSTNVNYTAVIGDRLELRCDVEAFPTASIQWYRRGIPIGNETRGTRIEEDGTLTIEESKIDDSTMYTCKATNEAGKTETNVFVNIIAPPQISDEDTPLYESIKIGTPLTLFCPVYSLPLPEITWFLDDKPLYEYDPSLVISPDRRKLYWAEATVKQPGVYKCVARNAAGESSKMFNIEVTHPLVVSEELYPLKWSVYEGENITIGCPVIGFPTPTVTWIINGKVLGPDEEYNGAHVTRGGLTVEFNGVLPKHEGKYQCIAQNKVEKVSVDIQLSVLAIPKLGPDERFAIPKGKSYMFTCDVLNGVEDSTVIRWSMNGSDNLPSNIEISMNGERLYITEISRENQGEYICRVSNSAGKGSKKIHLDVLELPEFVNPDHTDNWQFTEGRPLDLDCTARGNPTPVVSWFYDKKNATGEPISNDHRFRIEQIHGKSAVITCEAQNDGGTITRSFFVFKVSPPKISDESDGNPSVKEGGTLSLECPVSQGDFTITWLRQGSEITDDDIVTTLDGTRMTILNARKDHQDVYTCVASNTAGQASKDFNVEVHYPPKIAGSAVLTIQANAGTEVTLDCEADGWPRPKILWEKDSKNIYDWNGGQPTNDYQTIVFKSVSAMNSGHYQCTHQNSAGEASKTISLIVVDPPKWTTDEDPIKYVVNASRSLTIECPAEPGVNLEYSWWKDGMPLGVASYGWQLLGNGRMLHIPQALTDDTQDFSCAVSNSAGKITKAFSLYVQVGPTFNNIGGEHTVIEHNSLVLPCEVDGRPKPVIKWTKDGKPIDDLQSVQVLSEGQQFKIVHAEMRHRGTYHCSATNSYGTEEISFEVDVITRPTITKGVRDTVEVKEGETATFKCPIEDNNFRGQILWLRNLQPIDLDADPRLSMAQGDRRLSLKDSKLEDEGIYSCKLKNDAGETKFDYKLTVFVPPKIVMLEKDKKREVVELEQVVISCPATGKNEPKITWYKDGQQLQPDGPNDVIIRGNELVFEQVKDNDSGRYTCEAVNVAGSAEQEVNLFVMTKPKIEEEGIPNQFEGLRDQRITISCPVFGKPLPVISWLKAGKPLESNENVKTSANGQKLYFLKLSQDDSDTYTCLAKNVAGEASRDFAVTMLVSPSFDEPNIVRQIHTNAGKPSVLNCPAQGSPPPTITWLKDGISVEENERYLLLDGGRQLQISNTDESDEGRFTCIATNSVGSDDIETSLNVISPPVIDGPSVEKVTTNEGKRIDLECPTDTPDVDVEWQKNGLTITPETLRGDAYIQIPSSGKRLTFLSPESKDAGKYTCIVRNSAGETRKNLDFSINVPPFISMSGSSPLVQTVTPGSKVTVDCFITGEPFPKIKWYLDGVDIETTNLPFEYFNYNMSIGVNSIDESTIGKYTCAAENEAGKTHQDFIVRMKAPPTFDRNSESIDVKIGESIDLPCDVQSAIPVTYNWTGKSMRADIGPSDTKLLTLNDAQLSDQGVYTCIVENDAGQAKKMIELNIIDPPEFYDTQKNYPIVLGRPLTLDCSASGSPEPTIVWMKNGRRLNESYEPMMFGKTHLMIDNPQEDVAGRYTCIAENKAGRAEKDMIVAILKPPVMKNEVLEYNVLESGSVPLPCNVVDPTGDLEYTWYRNGSAITPTDRLQISIQKDKVHIMNAEISDTGKYTCVVKNQAGEARTDFYLTIDIPPKIEGDPFTSQSAVANQTVRLDCKANGRPTPTILWLFDGKPMLEKQNVEIADDSTHIILKNITTKEEGRYTCRVLNSVGQVDQDTYIEVLVPPTVVMPSDEMKVVAGKQTTVRCEVFGDPEPEVKWLKNGEEYVSDLLQYSKGFSYLHLRHASLRDSGRYTCIATNKAGEERASTVVQVLIPPSITEDERVLQAKENTTFSIHCSASGNPTPTFTWKKDGVEIPDATSPTLTLPNVESSSDGRYTCLAANEGGTAMADFMLDVITRPKFAESENEIKVIEGERTRLECRVDGHPKPTIKWLKGGRPLNMSNVLLSPRGEVLMILKARRSDGGSYSCVAKNAAGEAEAGFNVNILTVPYIEDQIDQNPKIVAGNTLRLRCPVRGNPKPTVRWTMSGTNLSIGEKYTSDNGQDLVILAANISDEGFYTCHAQNEAGTLDTNFAAEVIGKPTFVRQGDNVYEVIEDAKITIDCGVTSKPLPEISWYRGENPLYLSENFEISNDGMKLTIRNSKLTDGGKYTCRASNEAGSADIDLIVKVLVPPKIDKSNIIGNPLAIVTRNIYLECPVFGIPQPSVIWTKDGQPVNTSDSRIVFAHNNETFGIEGVQVVDQGRYTCTASNRGGVVAHDFNLDVLSPPVFEIADTKPTIKREGDTITLSCPIKMPDDVADQVMDVSWTKDSRALEGDSTDNIEISEDGRRLTISSASLSNAGMYSCIALNRAGETSLEFKVEILCMNLATQQCRELENNFIARNRPHVITTSTLIPQIDAYRRNMQRYEEYLRNYEDAMRRYNEESAKRRKSYMDMRRNSAKTQIKASIRKLISLETVVTTTTLKPTTKTTTTVVTTPPTMPWRYNPKFGHPIGAQGVMNVRAIVQHPTKLYRRKRVKPLLRCFYYDPIRQRFLREKSNEQLPPNRAGFLKYPLNKV